MKDVIERVAAKLCNLDFEPESPRWAEQDEPTSTVRSAYLGIATDLLRPMSARITALDAQLDTMCASASINEETIRQCDAALMLANGNRDGLMREVAALEAKLAAADRLVDLAYSALTECEAILGGEYGDHYGPLAETMTELCEQIIAYRALRGGGK